MVSIMASFDYLNHLLLQFLVLWDDRQIQPGGQELLRVAVGHGCLDTVRPSGR